MSRPDPPDLKALDVFATFQPRFEAKERQKAVVYIKWLREENERLREALEPFASDVCQCGGGIPSGKVKPKATFESHPCRHRRAAEVLSD